MLLEINQKTLFQVLGLYVFPNHRYSSKALFTWTRFHSVTASVSMRLRLSFTRRRSSSLSEPDRFAYAFKSGAFSKRYGFTGRVNSETALI